MAEMKNQVDECEDWDGLVRKTVTAEAKPALRPTSYIRKMNQRCSWGNRLISTTNTSENPGSTLKDPRTKDPKPKNFGSGSSAGSAPQHTDAEPSNKRSRSGTRKRRILIFRPLASIQRSPLAMGIQRSKSKMSGVPRRRTLVRSLVTSVIRRVIM